MLHFLIENFQTYHDDDMYNLKLAMLFWFGISFDKNTHPVIIGSDSNPKFLAKDWTSYQICGYTCVYISSKVSRRIEVSDVCFCFFVRERNNRFVCFVEDGGRKFSPMLSELYIRRCRKHQNVLM